MAFQFPTLGADSGSYTPETLARKQKMAQQLMGGAMGIQDIRHPLQGLAQMLQAGVGGYHMKQADETEATERERANKMFAELLSQGSEADMGALMGAAGDPWASDANQGLAQLLMGEQLKQRDPLYQQNLERGGLELEQLRDPQPDPGFELVTPEELLSMPNLDPNGAYQRGPDNRIYEIGGGGQTINVGGNNDIGTIPQGMMVTRDEAGNVTGMVDIPGGPTAREAEAAAAASAASGDRTEMKGNIVVQDIDRALTAITENPMMTTGIGSAVTGGVPSSPAYNVNSLIDTVKANAGFAELQQMRESSPTGGALGNVTEKEIAYLQATIGNLDPRQSPEQLQDNLKRVKNAYLDIVHGPGNGPPREPLSFDEQASDATPEGEVDYNASEPPSNWGGDPNLWRFMSPEDRALW